ncbi:MAG: transaldolase [Byssovorax cruenta]
MKANPLLGLEALGQSIWIDFIRRGIISSGELQKLVENDGVSGVTSNPSIFEKAIAESHDYDETIRMLTLEGKTPNDIYQLLTVEDIQMVADVLRPTYDRTEGHDGFVSLEVSPKLAHDTAGTIEEARRLWSLVDRPNTMIKVPATLEGLPAIQQLTGEGLNINITLLFGLARYREVANAYLSGLETLASEGKNLKQIASVASFFLSRIDVLLDPMFEQIMLAGGRQADLATHLHGQVATASAKIAYQIYKEVFGSDRFQKLASQGARTQRLLWASTSTKNPAYSDTKYVEPLIGPDTINTVPVETLDAYRDHGHPALTLDQGVPEADQILKDLSLLGIDLEKATQQLEEEGVEKFATAFVKLIGSLQEKQEALKEARKH